MAIYAKTHSEGVDITPGKNYKVTHEGVNGIFRIKDDAGFEITCLWDDCAHLGGGSWEKVEVQS